MPAALSANVQRQPPAKVPPIFDRLNRFLPAYWLRPENALWMTLRSAALSQVPWSRPVLDACCGDGIFSFLHLGGRFDPSFDVYCGVDHSAAALPARRDVYDAYSDNYRPRISTRPTDTTDVGSDHKAALLAKAERLGFYDELVAHDHNLPLPLPDESFQTIYCNAAYWMHNVQGLLAEFRRLLRPDGQLILHVKLDAMRRHTLEPLIAVLGANVLGILNGDRLDCWPGLTNRTTWEQRFDRANLKLLAAQPFVTGTHAYLWNIGLRPIAPLLMRMVAGLSADTRASIKKDWVQLFTTMLSPLCRYDLSISESGDEPVEIQYVLQRA